MVPLLIALARFAPDCRAGQFPATDFARVEWEKRAALRDRELQQSATSYLNVSDVARVKRGEKVFLDLNVPHEQARWSRSAPLRSAWLSLENRGQDAHVRESGGRESSLAPGTLYRAPDGLVIRVHAGESMAVYLHDPKHPKMARFHWLSRFAYDPAGAVAAEFDAAVKNEAIYFATTQGLKRRLFKAGRVSFSMQGKRFELDAFVWADDPGEDELFIPFRDRTNGKETYGGGRYVDVRMPRGVQTGPVLLDFNYAYHPLCARSHFFDCVLYPGNKLPIGIRAGERMPSVAEATRH